MLLVISSSISFSVDMKKDYSASEINELIDELGVTYDQIEVENIGASYFKSKHSSFAYKAS